MKSLDELKSELYSKYCTLKNSVVTDDSIQQQLVSSIETYSKFDIAVLNKYCHLDENSDDYNALALKLMVNFDEEFNKRIKEDEIFKNNLKKQLINNQESKIDKHKNK